jgi:hypothetical protein
MTVLVDGFFVYVCVWLGEDENVSPERAETNIGQTKT